MKILYGCFIFATLLVGAATSIAQECPPCYKNAIGPKTFKVARDDNGKVEDVVIVQIDSSWDISPGVTDPKIYNAVTRAIARWNAADPTGPHIQVDQNRAPKEVSVRVVKGTHKSGSLAVHEVNTEGVIWNSFPVLKLTLDPVNSSRDQEEVTGRVAHEMGHGIKGLDHPPPPLKDMPMPGITCPNSVMTPSNPDHTRAPVTNTPQTIDVDSAKKWRNDRPNCRWTAGKTQIDAYTGPDGEEAVPDPPLEEERKFTNCTELWEVTNWYIFNDGYKFIGSTYRRLSPPCRLLE